MDIATILNYWQNIGVFSYLLPFLLIFAVVYGILEASNILTRNKGVNATVAVVIGLLSLQVGYVQTFFTEAFPRFGVGIAVLLIVLILMGLFVGDTDKKVIYWVFIVIGGIIAFAVLFGTFSEVGWLGGGDWFTTDWVALVIFLILLVGLIAMVMKGAGSSEGKSK